jgi:hypothetical protein
VFDLIFFRERSSIDEHTLEVRKGCEQTQLEAIKETIYSSVRPQLRARIRSGVFHQIQDLLQFHSNERLGIFVPK